LYETFEAINDRADDCRGKGEEFCDCRDDCCFQDIVSMKSNCYHLFHCLNTLSDRKKLVIVNTRQQLGNADVRFYISCM
jgi:hypothetical protein